jgi:hypothetical protein
VFRAGRTNRRTRGHRRLATPAPEVNKATQRELDQHSRLREQFADAFAAVETSDHPADSDEARKLAAKRDEIAARLKTVADKLRARGYTLTNDDSMPAKV